MRRNIGYTGRRTLTQSSVEVKLYGTETGKSVALKITNPSAFKSLPHSSRIKLRLFENHYSETLMFGTLGEVENGVNLLDLRNHEAFSAPSVMLRVIESEGSRRGIVLGSTKRWTLRMEGEDEAANVSGGILLLQTRDIAPRIWKLDVREDEQPIVYIDSKIKNPYAWARTDVVFASCVFPAIIGEIFDKIYRSPELSEQQWATDWIDWAEDLSKEKFDHSAGEEDHEKWVNSLIDEFCRHHNLLSKVIHRLEED